MSAADKVTPREIARVLNEAADHIEGSGWWNGKTSATWRAGQNCAGFAITDSARGARAVKQAANYALSDFLGIGGDTYESLRGAIFDWNDSQTNAETVIAALRGAAEAQAVPA